MAVDVARPEISPPRTGAPRRTGRIVIGGLAAVAIVVRVADPERVAWMQNFLIVFGSLLVEAMPFVMLGALGRALDRGLRAASSVRSARRLPRPLQLPTAALAGLAFPVCECGSVPVARRLGSARADAVGGGDVHARRAHPQPGRDRVDVRRVSRTRHARGRWCCGRIALGMLVAVAVGWVVGQPRDGRPVEADAGRGRDSSTMAAGPASRAGRGSSSHLGGDFLFMGRYLVIGAAIAAAIQTFVPQRSLSSVAERFPCCRSWR